MNLDHIGPFKKIRYPFSESMDSTKNGNIINIGMVIKT
jgi:hypothetical protein